MTSGVLIDCENVTVYRGDRRALDRVTFTIPLGQHVAIVGPNGSGKSTLIKTLTRECYPFTGDGPARLRILDGDLSSVSDLRARLGIVTPDLAVALARDLTGREAVLSGFFSSIGLWPHQTITADMRRRANEVLEQLEVAHLAERPLTRMSTGEVRRVVIGRALVRAPTALVLDEPTTSLDLRSTVEVRDTIRRAAALGTTIVLVTHQFTDIVPEIDRVMLLQAGRIVADGRKAEVLTADRLAEVYGVRLQVAELGGYYHWW